ncbi:MAG: dimethylsulfonioproprionate lyase family protein [Alphaproteobacteria bacterium]
MGTAASRDFLTRFARSLSERSSGDPALAPFADAVHSIVEAPEHPVKPERSSHPITAHAGPLLDRATADPDLMEPLKRMQNSLPWYQIFQGGGADPVLAEGLFAAQMSGPAGFIDGGTIRVGLFLLGPNITYPLHCHAADEVYFGLSGALTLQHGWQGKPFTIEGGEYSVTPSNRLHSLQTGKDPVLLAFIWKGEINAPNWWWSQQGDAAWRRTSWVRTGAGAWTVDREEDVPPDLIVDQA